MKFSRELSVICCAAALLMTKPGIAAAQSGFAAQQAAAQAAAARAKAAQQAAQTAAAQAKAAQQAAAVRAKAAQQAAAQAAAARAKAAQQAAAQAAAARAKAAQQAAVEAAAARAKAAQQAAAEAAIARAKAAQQAARQAVVPQGLQGPSGPPPSNAQGLQGPSGASGHGEQTKPAQQAAGQPTAAQAKAAQQAAVAEQVLQQAAKAQAAVLKATATQLKKHEQRLESEIANSPLNRLNSQATKLDTLERMRNENKGLMEKQLEAERRIRELERQKMPASDPRMKAAIKERDSYGAEGAKLSRATSDMLARAEEPVKQLYAINRMREENKELMEKQLEAQRRIDELERQKVPASDPRMKAAIEQRDSYGAEGAKLSRATSASLARGGEALNQLDTFGSIKDKNKELMEKQLEAQRRIDELERQNVPKSDPRMKAAIEERDSYGAEGVMLWREAREIPGGMDDKIKRDELNAVRAAIDKLESAVANGPGLE